MFIFLLVFISICFYFFKNLFFNKKICKEKLENKRIIITGSSQGIGEELAYEYSTYQCRLILAARNIHRLNNEIKIKCLQLGAKEVQCIEFDASKEENCRDLINQSNEFYGGIDILILNHTASIYQSFFDNSLQMNIDETKRLFQTNFFAYFYLAMFSLSSLSQSGRKEDPSKILVISSLAGTCPLPKTTIYGTTKHSIQGFFLNLNRELFQSKIYQNRIEVKLINLGLIATKNALEKTDSKLHFLAANVKKTAQFILKTGFSRQTMHFYPSHFSLIPLLFYLFPSIFQFLTRFIN